MKQIQFQLQQTNTLSDYDTLILPVFEQGNPTELVQSLNLDSLIADLSQAGDFSAKPASVQMLLQHPSSPCTRLLLVGMGSSLDTLTNKSYLESIHAAAKALDNSGAQNVLNGLVDVFPAQNNQAWAIYQNTLVIQRSLYDYEHESRNKAELKDPKLNQVTFNVSPSEALQSQLEQAQATALGMALTQDLANMPSNLCTPSYLADTAQELGDTYGFEVNTLDAAEMIEMGMGAFMAVAQGSHTPPKMICLAYRGADPTEAPIALVGKGVTFDTGGISIKPGEAMDEMKYDMGGAATVLGVFKALGQLKPKLNVVAVIPATENMPAGNAIKPGDVVTSLSGQTIEILNTDAEGRLILCDALTYAQQTYQPCKIIDMATLTGACIIALGHQMSAVLGNNQPLIDELLTSGQKTYDRFWQMPLSEEYDEQLKSNFANMANIGGRPAGTITAAQFLARFTQSVDWAHLDIAGTAWVSGKNKGATGRPVPALVDYLIRQQ